MRALCATARASEPTPGQGAASGSGSGSGPAPDLALGSAAAAGGRAGAAPQFGVAGGEGLAAGFVGGPGDAAVVRWADFEAALQRVRPSITRGWEAELAPASWDDIGGLDRVKARLRQARSQNCLPLKEFRPRVLAACLTPHTHCLRHQTEQHARDACKCRDKLGSRPVPRENNPLTLYRPWSGRWRTRARSSAWAWPRRAACCCSGRPAAARPRWRAPRPAPPTRACR